MEHEWELLDIYHGYLEGRIILKSSVAAFAE